MRGKNLLLAGLLALIASGAQAQIVPPPPAAAPQGLAAETDSAGFARGRYVSLDSLPDWGGIWFLAIDRTAPPLPPPQLKGEYLTQREEWRAEVLANNGVERRARSNCSPPGLPRIMALAQYPYEFLFTPGRVTINQEAWMQTRTIWTDGRSHPPLDELDPSYHGHSIGRWELGGAAPTLVVDTIGISEELEFGEGGVHSDQFRLTERIYISPENPDILINEMRMEDPLALAEPFIMLARYRRDRHGMLIEFQCSQNDRNPVNEAGETLFE